MQLDISDPEYELLVEILHGYQGDLRTEIQHTDNPVYKKQLKEEENLLGSVLRKLRALKSSAA